MNEAGADHVIPYWPIELKTTMFGHMTSGWPIEWQTTMFGHMT